MNFKPVPITTPHLSYFGSCCKSCKRLKEVARVDLLWRRQCKVHWLLTRYKPFSYFGINVIENQTFNFELYRKHWEMLTEKVKCKDIRYIVIMVMYLKLWAYIYIGECNSPFKKLPIFCLFFRSGFVWGLAWKQFPVRHQECDVSYCIATVCIQ